MISGVVSDSLQASTNHEQQQQQQQQQLSAVKEGNPPVIIDSSIAAAAAVGPQSGDSSGEFTSVNSIIDAVSSTIALMVPDAVVGDGDTDEHESGVSGVDVQPTSEAQSGVAPSVAPSIDPSEETAVVGGSTPKKKSSKKKNVLKQLLRSSSSKQSAASRTDEEEEESGGTTTAPDFVPAQPPLQATDTSTGGDGGTAESTSIIDVVSNTIAMMVPDSLVSTAEEARSGKGESPNGVGVGGGPEQPASTDASSSKKALVHSSSKGDHPPEVPSVSRISPDRAAASSGSTSLASWLFPNANAVPSAEQDEESEVDSTAAAVAAGRSPLQLGLFRSASKRGKSPDPSPATQSDIRGDEATTAASTTSSVLDALSNTIAMIIPDAALGQEEPVVEEAAVEPAKKPFIRRQLQSMFRRDSSTTAAAEESAAVPLPPSGPSAAVEQVGGRGSSSSSTSSIVAAQPPPLQTNGGIARKAATTTFQKPKSVNKSIKFADSITK
jgi:hypothetical protein